MEDTSKETGEVTPPTHIAYHVRKGRDEKNYWTRIGAGWMHKNGKSFALVLDCLPPNGHITLLLSKPKKAE